MNTQVRAVGASTVPNQSPLDRSKDKQWAENRSRCNAGKPRYELWLFGVALLLLNLPLLRGGFSDSFIFLPEAVRTGEWWRLLTHPFVHVSWLHLSLDGVAFVVLYYSLEETSKARRLLCVAACAASSLGAFLLIGSFSDARGLCGLSGIAHGLMALSALEMMERNSGRGLGLFCFVIAVGKSVVESLCGHVLFESVYAGLLGTPVAVCHAGGVFGGVLAYLVTRAKPALAPTRSTADNRQRAVS